jgi:hypothetical protein
MTTTRRNILAGATALAAGAIVPVGASLAASALCTTDAAFTAAETEIMICYQQWDRLSAIDEAAPDTKAAWDRAQELDAFIARTPPTSIAQTAVKLRRLLDATVGLPIGPGDDDIPSLLQALDFLERFAGKPTHPTRPIISVDDDDDEPVEGAA